MSIIILLYFLYQQSIDNLKATTGDKPEIVEPKLSLSFISRLSSVYEIYCSILKSYPHIHNHRHSVIPNNRTIKPKDMKSPPSTLKIRVSASTAQGGRRYMEDRYSIVHYKSPQSIIANVSHHDPVLGRSFVYLGIFDGHGGEQAAQYVSKHLCKAIVCQRAFWSADDENVKLAIHRGFIRTHKAMLSDVLNWPKTVGGQPSTSGTTASIVFIMNGKYYTGHVGDSRIVLGRTNHYSARWTAHAMTHDHKPESAGELSRIESAGGRVLPSRSGIGRVVWNRPRLDNQQVCDVIPFLAVARALGDFWSYQPRTKSFVVSPEPDVNVVAIDPRDKCLILASDGLWNILSFRSSVDLTRKFEYTSGEEYCFEQHTHASTLLNICLEKWATSKCRADNVTVVIAMLDQSASRSQELVSARFVPACANFPVFYDQDDEYEEDEYNENEATDDDELIGRIVHSIDYDNKTQSINADDDLQIPTSIKRDVTAVVESLLNRVCHDEDINMSLAAGHNFNDENQLDQAQLAMIDFDRIFDKIQDKVNYNCNFYMDIDSPLTSGGDETRTVFQSMCDNSVSEPHSPVDYFQLPFFDCNLSLLNSVVSKVETKSTDDFQDQGTDQKKIYKTNSFDQSDAKDLSANELDKHSPDDNSETFVRPRTSSYTSEMVSAVRLPKICYKRKSYLEQLNTEAKQMKLMCSEKTSTLTTIELAAKSETTCIESDRHQAAVLPIDLPIAGDDGERNHDDEVEEEVLPKSPTVKSAKITLTSQYLLTP